MKGCAKQKKNWQRKLRDHELCMEEHKKWRHDIQKLDLFLDLHCEKCTAEQDSES